MMLLILVQSLDIGHTRERGTIEHHWAERKNAVQRSQKQFRTIELTEAVKQYY